MKLRVDWEPSSGTNGDGVFQVQSGSGKSGYSLDEYIEVNIISGRKSIEDWVNTNRQLRKLGTSTKEEIINRIFRVVEIITETRWTICDYTSKVIMLKK